MLYAAHDAGVEHRLGAPHLDRLEILVAHPPGRLDHGRQVDDCGASVLGEERRMEWVDGPAALVQVVEAGSERRLLTLAAERGGVVEFAIERPSLAEIYREVTA